MKLDLDLVRKILAHVNRQPLDDDLIDLSIGGYGEHVVSEHVALLEGLGYVTASRIWTFQGEVWKSVRLTWKGSDFLARADDDAVWDRAKQMVSQRVVGGADFQLEVLKGLLDAAADELSGG